MLAERWPYGVLQALAASSNDVAAAGEGSTWSFPAHSEYLTKRRSARAARSEVETREEASQNEESNPSELSRRLGGENNVTKSIRREVGAGLVSRMHIPSGQNYIVIARLPINRTVWSREHQRLV